jgi:4-amino-4-deoxy-L-arabinose transferase-like glycosyltransferase
VTLLAILLLAAFLRTVDLSGVPPGLQHDEVFYAHDAFTVRQGRLTLFFPENQGREPLFIYMLALTTTLLGNNALAIRFPAVVSGLLTVVLVYRWGWAAFGRRVGMIAALFVAIGFWPLWLSRVGLRAVTLPPLVAFVGWLYSRAARPSSKTKRQITIRMATVGFAMGLTFYSYAAAYALPIIFAVYYVYLLVFRRDVLQHSPLGHALFWLTAVVTYLPLWLALSTIEGGYARFGNVSQPLQAMQNGDPLPLLEGIKDTLLMWTHRGDPLWRYNVAEAPVFGIAAAVIFIIGILVTLGGRREQYVLLILWLFLGVAPCAVTDLPPSSLRAVTTLPATYLVLAVGLDGLRELASRRRALAWVWPSLLVTLAAMGLWRTSFLYFDVWRTTEDVQRVYRADLAEVATFLRTHTPPDSVGISTTEPNHLDPFIFDYTPHGSAANIRWFDGLYALVFPAGPEPAWVFVTMEPTPPERLQPYLDSATFIEEQRFDNSALAFALYALPPGDAALEAHPPQTGQGIWFSPLSAFPPDDPDGVRQTLTYPVQFGDVVQLVGYEAGSEIHHGDWLPLTLVWRVTRDVTTPEPWSIFVHLLSPEGELAAGRDFLPVPASTWREGDVFIELHDLPTDPALAEGIYHLEIGLYTLADGSRFPVIVDDEPVGDRLLLEPVTVGP